MIKKIINSIFNLIPLFFASFYLLINFLIAKAQSVKDLPLKPPPYFLPDSLFSPSRVSDIQSFGELVKFLLNTYVIPLLIGAGVIYFLVGTLKYIRSGGDEEKRKEGVKMMTYGVIAIFVMVSIWGLVNVLGGTLNLNTTAPPAPSYP